MTTNNEIYSLYFRNFVKKSEIMIFSHDGLQELVAFENSNKMHNSYCQDGEIISLNFVLLNEKNHLYILRKESVTLTYYEFDSDFHDWKLERLYLNIKDIVDNIKFILDENSISGYRIEKL